MINAEYLGLTAYQLAKIASKLEDENAKLHDEVERLRKAKDTIHGDAFEISGMLVKAMDENAKLRKLAYGFRYCSKTLVCKGCPLYDPSEPDYCRGGKLERELGIKEN